MKNKNEQSLGDVTYTRTHKYSLKNNKAITLVALIITIIVLLILAGVSINFMFGQEGIFTKAQTAVEKYKNAQIDEEMLLAKLENKIDSINGNRDDINTEQLKKMMLDVAYPVGSIYITTDSKNPSETLGGTWQSYGEGRTIIGAGQGTDTNEEVKSFSSGDTGGEYNHRLTENQLPRITGFAFAGAGYAGENNIGTGAFRSASGVFSVDQTTRMAFHWSYSNKEWTAGYYAGLNFSMGNDESHNNIQPYIVTYMWKRIS